MAVQTTPAHTGALVSGVQTIAHLEVEAGYRLAPLIHAQEILDENRFLAARDGMRARLMCRRLRIADGSVPRRRGPGAAVDGPQRGSASGRGGLEDSFAT